MSYDHDHSAVPAVYTCTCDGCGKPLKRVMKHRAWEPFDPSEDYFSIECWSCGEQTLAFRDFPEPETPAAFGAFA